MGMLLNSFGRVSRRHLHSIRCEQSGHYNALSAPHVWPFGKALVVIRSRPTGREQPSPVADTTGQHKSEVSRELGTSELNASVQASPVPPRFSLAMKSFFAALIASAVMLQASAHPTAEPAAHLEVILPPICCLMSTQSHSITL